MGKEKSLRVVLLVSTLFALLLMALLFDFAVTSMQISNSQTGSLDAALLLLFPLFELLLVVGGMGILWYLISSGARSRLLSAVFLVVGLIIVFSLPLLYFLPVPMSLLVLVQFLQPGTYMFQAGAMAAAIGLFSLFLKPPAVLEAAEPMELEAPMALE